MYITTCPGACLFDSFVRRINVTYRALNDMLGHVKILVCILWLEVMGFTLIKYLIIKYLVNVL